MIINYIIWTDIDHKHVEIPKYKAKFDEDGKVLNEKEIGRNMALFVPKEYEAFLPTDFNIPDISSIEHYYLRKYIPFYLNDGSDQKITWERDGNLFYNRDDIIWLMNGYFHD